MPRPCLVPDLTTSESRLLPLLTTSLSLNEIGRLLDVSRDAIEAQAVSIFAKLGLSTVGDGDSDGR